MQFLTEENRRVDCVFIEEKSNLCPFYLPNKRRVSEKKKNKSIEIEN